MALNFSSLRDSTIDKIGNFLYSEGFAKCDKTPIGILELINLISDYYEEGNHLFPEIIIMDNIDLLKTIPSRELLIYDGDLEVSEFKQAIKLCAPLALNNWLIFIEVKNGKMKYGLTSAEIAETSLSMYKQAIEMKNEGFIVAYIRNIGKKTVELTSNQNKCVISLTLDEANDILKNEVLDLSIIASSECEEQYSTQITTYLEKLINEAIKIGHGNLIAVVKDDETIISQLKGILNGGVFLQRPIDLSEMIKNTEEAKSNITSVELKSFSSLVVSMLNHDGITVFTSKGRVIGYHFIIDNKIAEKTKIVGGSRTRAFEAMVTSNLCLACFMKSQDGNIKFYKK